MTVNINPELLRSTIKQLEQEQLSRSDRSALIRLLRELSEAIEKSPQLEGEPLSVIKVKIHGALDQQRQVALDERLAEMERARHLDLNLGNETDLAKELSTILDTTFDQVADVYDCYIFLYEAGRLTFGAGRAATSREELPWRSPRPRGLTYTVARMARTMIIPDMSTHPLFADLNWTGSIIGIPLKIGPRVVGVMTVCRRPEREFSTEDLYALQSLADQAAMTMETIRLHSLAAEQIRIDASTGLHNRRALDEHIQAEVVAAVEGQFPFALFLLNLDGFDEINQRYGRSAGDFLLAETATAVAKELRKTDFIARFDASRYSLVLDRTDRSTASAIAERILDIITRRRFSLPEKGARKVSISIGAAVFPDDGTTPDKMIEAAKMALDLACNQPGSVQFASQPVETGTAHPAP